MTSSCSESGLSGSARKDRRAPASSAELAAACDSTSPVLLLLLLVRSGAEVQTLCFGTRGKVPEIQADMPSRAVPVSQRAQGERQSHRRAAAAPDDVCDVIGKLTLVLGDARRALLAEPS